MRILLVEDDADLGYGIQLGLHKQGHTVDLVEDGLSANHWLLTQLYDVVILDIGLPRMSGLEVLKTLRLRKSDIPVLLLTARDSITDRVEGLDAGADDYLVKPFSMEEFSARVRALLRRGTGTSAILTCGKLQVDTRNHSVSVEDELIKITPRDYVLLEVLLLHPGQLVPKDDLIQRFSSWDNELGGNAIEVSIFRLRKKLEPYGIAIQTVRGAGYLITEVQP
ncbi:MAG: response regulator transcription factor [Pseudomonadales bacterium]|nr:response regulator transcription factor [Pseudomonadales bacterium]